MQGHAATDGTLGRVAGQGGRTAQCCGRRARSAQGPRPPREREVPGEKNQNKQLAVGDGGGRGGAGGRNVTVGPGPGDLAGRGGVGRLRGAEKGLWGAGDRDAFTLGRAIDWLQNRVAGPS